MVKGIKYVLGCALAPEGPGSVIRCITDSLTKHWDAKEAGKKLIATLYRVRVAYYLRVLKLFVEPGSSKEDT